MKPLLLLIFVTIFNLTSVAYTTYVYQLPFEEKFTTGFFTTNEWTVEGMNWMISGQQGNPLPSAMFTSAPADANYSKSLISQPMNGGFISGKIFLDYDIKLDDELASGQEKLSAEVFDGTQWVTVYTDSSAGDFDWKGNHVDITEVAKGNTFQIRFRAYGVNTTDINNWLIDNIKIYRLCEPPLNLTIQIPNSKLDVDQLLLTWEVPDIPHSIAEWINYDDNENFTGIGITMESTWSAAVRFTQSQLSNYIGCKLTKIRFVPTVSEGSTYTLKVWTGENASTLVLSQPLSSVVYDAWNDYTLITPVEITGNTELWFGYEIIQTVGGYPAGCDNGPAVDGYGNMVGLNGVWQSLYSFSSEFDYNWNIQGWIEADSNNYETIDLAGYNIYYENEWIDYTTEQWYFDNLSFRDNEYCYNVTALYQDCESEFSNTDCEWVGIEDFDLTNISIYPNPASTVAIIELDIRTSQIVIYNLHGEVIDEVNVNSSKQTISLDLTYYPNGIYLVKFISSTGDSSTRKLIVSK